MPGSAEAIEEDRLLASPVGAELGEIGRNGMRRWKATQAGERANLRDLVFPDCD